MLVRVKKISKKIKKKDSKGNTEMNGPIKERKCLTTVKDEGKTYSKLDRRLENGVLVSTYG